MAETTVQKSGWRTLDLVYIALFSVLTAVCSWIAVPFTVPFTMQTFAVFLTEGLLGGKRSTYAVLVYLLLGAAGIPVFSEFRGGLGILLGATGGYLLGFLGSALVYWLVTKRFGSRGWVQAAAMVLGMTVCYAFGTAWFMVVYVQTSGSIGILTALSWCVFPFLLPDLAKLVLALVLTRRLGRYLK
jgi:biotin transport system substrate-specific component